MAKKEYSLAHTKWMCKYHIVFTPKYRRKVIYNQYKADIRDIIKQLCSYKGVEISGVVESSVLFVFGGVISRYFSMF